MSKASKILEELNEEASIKWKKHCDLYHPYNRARYIAWEATSEGKRFIRSYLQILHRRVMVVITIQNLL